MVTLQALARFFPILPPPARMTRRMGLSIGLSSFMTAGMSRVAARKNTSVVFLDDGTRLPAGSTCLCDKWLQVVHLICRAYDVASVYSFCPTSRPPASASVATSWALPSAKSITCKAPGYSIRLAIYWVSNNSGLIRTSTGECSRWKSLPGRYRQPREHVRREWVRCTGYRRSGRPPC